MFLLDSPDCFSILLILLLCISDGSASLDKRFLEAQIETGPYYWTPWTNWSSCNGTCTIFGGTGIRVRTRSCDDGRFYVKIHFCQVPYAGHLGLLEDSVELTGNDGLTTYQTKTCQVNCTSTQHVNIWNPWQAWSQCGVTCGIGKRSRSRTCSTGCDCIGQSIQYGACFEQSCVIDGGWGAWTPYGECSQTCGLGTTERTRKCDNPAPGKSGKPCTGISKEVITCMKGNCTVDGGWGSWSDFTNCSRTCGNGVQHRHRQCDNPAPQHGGQNCTGSAQDFKPCAMFSCPIDGGWSEFVNISCSVTCGRGQLVLLRYCNNPSPQNGGKPCSGSAHRISECNLPSCVIDGKWSNWSHYTECGSVCGDGYTLRYRTCTSPAPQNGGKNCAGVSEQRLSCNNGPCQTRR